jgi:hypothetical protein
MKKTDLLTHSVWMVLALAVAAESGRLGFGNFIRPGPGFVPFLAGLCLGVLAVIGFFQAAAGKQTAGTRGALRGSDLRRIGLVTAVLFLYVSVWDSLGFLPSTFLLLLFLYRCVEPLRWRTVFTASALTLAFTYLLFSVLLKARLPAGRLWTYFTN